MNGRSAFVAFVALVVVASTATTPVAAALGDGAAASERIGGSGPAVAALPPASQTLNATEEVKIWERSIFTLRADTSKAAVSVDNAAWDASLEGTGTKSLGKDEIGVYQVNKKIPLTFKDERAVAEKELKDENVQVVAARLDGDQSDALDSFSTIEGLRNLLTDENANDNATFTMVNSGVALDSKGDGSFSFTPTDPGQYVLFVSSTENGSLSVTGGDVAITGDNVTVVGVEALAVQRGSSSVSADKKRYSPGENVSFSVDTASSVQTSGNVSHAILLYDEETYTDGTFTLVADGHLDSSFDVSNDVTLEHSIVSVDGVQRSVGDPTAFGISADSGVSEGNASLESVLNFLVQNTSLSSSLKPKTSAQGSTVLDASMTVVNGTASDSVLVKTRSGWRNACYRWIHVATDDSGTEFASRTGTIGVGKSCGGGGSSGSGGGGPDRSSTVDTPGTTVTTSGNVDVSVQDTGGTTSITISGTTPGSTVDVQRTAGQVQSDLQTQGAALEGLNTRFTGETDFDMRISNTPDKPDPSVPDPPSDKGTVGYINVDHSASDDAVGEVSFNFRVTQERLDAQGIDRDEVVLYRYSGGEWTALETEFVGLADDGTPRFRAVSPGLSVFAIGSRQAQQATPTTTAPTETTAPPTETATASPTAAPPTTTLAEPSGFGGTSLVLLVVAILAIVALGGLYWYRQQG